MYLNPKTYLEWPDFAFILLVLVVCSAIGWYFKQKKSSGKLSEFILASRNLTVVPAALSIAATAMSAFSMNGITSELYLYGPEYAIGWLSAFVFLSLGAFVFVPKYRSRQYVSVFELMEERFDSSVRKVFSFAYVFQKQLFLSVVIYLAALSLSTLTQFDHRVTTFVLGFVCTSYSSLGGLRAVIWTDVIQFVLMNVTLLMVIFQGLARIGSVGHLWTKCLEAGFLTNFHWFENSTTRYGIWSCCLGGLLAPVDCFVVNQAFIQKVLGAKSESAAKASVIFGSFLNLVMGAVIVLVGAVLYVMYSDCDPTLFPDHTGVTRVDQIFVYAIGDLFMNYPVLKGVAIAGIISASLSTFSSLINSFAAVALEDFIKPIFPNLARTERSAVLTCMILSFAFGISTTCVSFVVPLIGNAVFAMSILSGVLRGPLLGAAFLVFFYKKLTKKACLFSLFFGMLVNSWIIAGSYLYVGPRKYPTLPHSSRNCDTEYLELFPDSENLDENFTSLYTTMMSLEMNTTLFNTKMVHETLTAKESVFMPFYKIPWIWYVPVGLAVTIVAGIVFSEISNTCTVTKRRSHQISKTYSKAATRNESDKMREAETIELT